MSIRYEPTLYSALLDIEEFISRKMPLFLEALGQEALEGRELEALKGAITDLQGLSSHTTKIKARIEHLYKGR